MSLFLAESYPSGVTEASFRESRANADRAAAAAGPEQVVHCVDAILIPDDGVVFFLFDGPSVEAVRAVVRRAGIAADRVVETVRADIGEGAER